MALIDTNKLKRELEGVKKEMRDTTTAALARESATMTDAEAQRYSDLETQKREIEGKISTAERHNSLETDDALAREAEQSQLDSRQTQQNPEDEKRFKLNGRDVYAAFGEVCQAVVRSQTTGVVDRRLVQTRAQTGMGEDLGSTGGYLVQTDILDEIMKHIVSESFLAPRARRIPIGANSNGLAWREVDETSRATGSRYGALRGYWVDSGTAVTASSIKYSKKKMDLEKLMSVVPVTDELMADAPALGASIDLAISEEFGWMFDDAILNGNGSGMPLGYFKSGCKIEVAKEAGQAADTIVFENITKMRSRMALQNRRNSIWVCNLDCEPQLQTMAFVVGTGGVPVYMPAAGVSGAAFDTLYGRPVFPLEQCQTVGDAGDIAYLDMSQYLIIDKGGIKRDVSMEIYFLTDQQALRFVLRVNGQPRWSSAITPANSTSTISPCVTLAERA